MKANEKKEVKGYFENTAEKWDEMRREYYDEQLRDIIINRAGINEGAVVLDIGIGTGFLTLGAARAVGKSGKVIGVDLSEAMLNKAKENLNKNGLADRVEFRIGDAENVPLEDNSVDIVIGNMVLHHCPDPQRAVMEMARVLKNGGKLVISDLEEHKEGWLKNEMSDLWLGFNLRKIHKMFIEAKLKNVKVELAKTKCCGVSLAGRKVAIWIFIAEGIK
ncbi:MAG: methyltransferase domain-containing protein [Halobacteria archaeon]|nr:methyltransferase domain-containing protein [Candidatus Bathyarchaeota archaeon]